RSRRVRLRHRTREIHVAGRIVVRELDLRREERRVLLADLPEREVVVLRAVDRRLRLELVERSDDVARLVEIDIARCVVAAEAPAVEPAVERQGGTRSEAILG